MSAFYERAQMSVAVDPVEANAPMLSICIVSFKVCSLLRQCLESLLVSVGDRSFEIIVIDNSSNDGSVEMIQEDFPQVRLVVNSTNVGYAPAANQALAMTRGRLILMLNPDTVVGPRSVATLVRFLENHPEAGAVGARMVDGSNQLISSWHSSHLLLATVPFALNMYGILPRRLPLFGKFLSREFGRLDRHEQTREVDMLDGACILLPRATLEAVGGLDENFVFGADDYDWSYRVTASGRKLYYLPEAQIVHLTHQSWTHVQEWTLAQRVLSWLRLVFKWRGKRQLYVAQSLIVVGFLARAVFVHIGSFISNDGRHLRLHGRMLVKQALRVLAVRI